MKQQLLFKTIILAAALCVGTSAWAEATVQDLGSNTTKTFTFTSSQTDILSGSTLTLDGMVMTFMGTNNTWKWNSSNNGMVGQNTPGGTQDTYYNKWSTSNGIPTYGSVYKFEASASGIVYLGGKMASTKYYIVKDDAGTLTVIKEVSASAGWADIRFEMKSGETYYFFQLGSELNAGRYTLTTVSFTKWSDISLTAVSESKTWNYAALKAAQGNLGQSTDGTIWVKNMTDDSANSRLKFKTTLGSNPTELGEDMIAFKAGVAGQVYMKLVDYNTTVSVYDGTTKTDFVGPNSTAGTSQSNVSYHGGNTYFKYATFQAEADKIYYIYRTAASGSSPNAGVYSIEFQPTGNNTTTALTDATTWSFVTQKDILTEYHGITKDNMFFGEGITDVYTNDIGYRITFNGTGNTATGANVLSFKLPANVKGYISLMPSCYNHKLVLKAGNTTLKEFTTGNNGDHNKDISVWVATDTETTIYLYCPDNSVTSNYPGTRYITWTPAPANISATTTSAGKGWATLYTQYPLDFSGVAGLTAYTATVAGNTVTLNPVNDIPANTGVVLKSTTINADVLNNIPVIASSTTPQGSLEGSATDALAYDANDTYNYYMLKLNGSNEAQFSKLTGGTIAAGKAYLKNAKTNAPTMFNVVFADDNTTGINSVQGSGLKVNGYFDLQGRKVANPTKGLYIVNGRKVVIK